jgi:hypothetical protein
LYICWRFLQGIALWPLFLFFSHNLSHTSHAFHNNNFLYYYYYYKPNYKYFFWFVFGVLQLSSTFYLELCAYFDADHDNDPTDR